MAGCEKVCELTGEYCGPDMYRYKRDLIQISKEARKRFRGDSGHLLWWVSGYEVYNPRGLYCQPYDKDCMYQKSLLVDSKYKLRPIYTYVYQTSNPDLQGSVEGDYTNTTRNISKVIRKIKRLTRNYKLDHFKYTANGTWTWYGKKYFIYGWDPAEA